VQLGHERRAELAAHSEPLGGILVVYGALDIEQDINPLRGLERDRVDHAGVLAGQMRSTPCVFSQAQTAGDLVQSLIAGPEPCSQGETRCGKEVGVDVTDSEAVEGLLLDEDLNLIFSGLLHHRQVTQG